MKKIIGLFFFLGIVYSCRHTNRNDEKFNKIIHNAYIKSQREHDSIIDLKKLFPFEWDKMYVFSREHYPEADSRIVSKIAGVDYRRNMRNYDNRLILFTKGNKIVFDVLSAYKSDDFSKKDEPLKVNFYITKETPDYFSRDDSKFILISIIMMQLFY